MNELDKEIEEFSENLNKVDEITRRIAINDKQIRRLLNETTDIDKVKKELQNAIEKMDTINENTHRMFAEEIDKITTKLDQNNKELLIEITSINTSLNNSIEHLEKRQTIILTLLILVLLISIAILVIVI